MSKSKKVDYFVEGPDSLSNISYSDRHLTEPLSAEIVKEFKIFSFYFLVFT